MSIRKNLDILTHIFSTDKNLVTRYCSKLFKNNNHYINIFTVINKFIKTVKKKNTSTNLNLSKCHWQIETNCSSDHEEEWITANLFGMVLPGYKTTETLIAMCAYVLALHQDVQDKVRDEINATFESNQDDLDFAAVNRMTYIDMVINGNLITCFDKTL